MLGDMNEDICRVPSELNLKGDSEGLCL